MEKIFEIFNNDKKLTYNVLNTKKGCHVFCYIDGLLWCKYIVRGRFDEKYPDIQQFLTSKIFSNDIYIVKNYLKNQDKFLKEHNTI